MEQYRDFAFVYDELMNEVDYNGWVKYIEDIIKNVDIVGYNLKTEKFGIKGNYIPGFMGKVNIKVKGSAEFKNNISFFAVYFLFLYQGLCHQRLHHRE